MKEPRLLPPDEYERLKTVAWFADGFPLPRPETSIVVVLEDDNDHIIGFWMANGVVHVEPLWVAEEYRGLNKTRLKLLQKLLEELRKTGSHFVFAFAPDEQAANILQRLGLQQIKGIHSIHEGAI